MNPIEVTGLHKSFRGKPALRGLQLTIAPGRLLGFVGPNGSGKTTCLRILLGILSADSGKVQVLGMNPERDAQRIRQHCSYLPGETSIYRHMRGADFLHFALSFHPSLQHDLMSRLTGNFQLPLQRRIRDYSAGMKQKLALMAALIPDVELYILDEPDRALDATTRFFVRDVLRDLRDAGKTILLSSHHLRDLEAIADEYAFVMDGTRLPADRVAEARQALHRRVRLKLRPGARLPGGADLLRVDADGTHHVQPHEPPAEWLARIPPADLDAAEIGTVHLEDLYRLLTEGAAQ